MEIFNFKIFYLWFWLVVIFWEQFTAHSPCQPVSMHLISFALFWERKTCITITARTWCIPYPIIRLLLFFYFIKLPLRIAWVWMLSTVHTQLDTCTLWSNAWPLTVWNCFLFLSWFRFRVHCIEICVAIKFAIKVQWKEKNRLETRLVTIERRKTTMRTFQIQLIEEKKKTVVEMRTCRFTNKCVRYLCFSRYCQLHSPTRLHWNFLVWFRTDCACWFLNVRFYYSIQRKSIAIFCSDLSSLQYDIHCKFINCLNVSNL